MPKFIRRGLVVSILLHLCLLLGVLFWSIPPATEAPPKKLEFISLEYLASLPPEPEPLPPALPRPEVALTGSSAPHPKKITKRPVTQNESPTAAAPGGAGIADSAPEVAAPGPEPATEGGSQPGEAASISPGQLALSFGDFQRIKGELVMPPVKGKIERGLPMTALPTFTPSAITAANQAPLRELLGPFSAYLHAMHLKIHPFWSEGALANFEAMDAESPLNNLALELTIELVINADGSLESATQLGSSGDSRYDMMAMYAVKHAAPFGTPPARLRSYQDRVYVRWTLYRDARECASSFAQPFWLTTEEAPAQAEPAEVEPLVEAAPTDEPSNAKERLIAGAKAVKDSLGPAAPIKPGAKADGFGGASALPDHGAFESSGGELIIPFNLSKKRPAAPPVDELSKRKR